MNDATTTIFDVIEQQLTAVQAAIDSARATVQMMRAQAEAAQRARQPAERQKPRTFGSGTSATSEGATS